MILLLDTSTSVCHLTLIVGDERFEDSWEAGRNLAQGLLSYIEVQLNGHNAGWGDLAGIGVFQGPGSFTGLRIGMTVANTLAGSLGVPIVGAVGDNWVDRVLERLRAGENDGIVLPLYGAEANITTPRK